MYTMKNLPDAIKKLPKHAQEIWLAAYNSAHEQYKGDEEKANATAWAAVEEKYEKEFDGKWHEKEKGQAARIVEFVRITGASGAEGDGSKWRVQVIEFGPDKQGRIFWDKDVLVAALEKFEGAKVFALTEAQHQATAHPFGKSVRDLIGWIDEVKATDKGIDGVLHILKYAQWLRDALVDSWESGKKDLIGLSVDIGGKAATKNLNGKPMKYLSAISDVTVDVVYDPVAGGQFLRMAAGMADRKEETKMLEKMLTAIKELRPDIYSSIEAKVKDGTITEDEVCNLLMKAMAESAKAAAAQDSESVKAAQKTLAEARLVAGKVILRDELGGSGLPDLSQAKLKKQFEGKAFEVESLQAAIKEEKEYIDKLTGSGAVSGAGGVKIGEEDIEKRIKMLDDFFERKIHSFKAAYVSLTGDEKITGEFKAAARLRASIESTNFAEMLGDSIARRMVKEYNAAGLDDWKKIAEIVPVSDFRTNRRPRMGGYGDLTTVAQGGAYPAIVSPGDEEATYSASKKGGTEDITLEAIKNDDVGAIRRIPTKLARAAARTLHKFVFDFLSTNANIYDATALFTVGHGNLGSTALASAALALRRQAMLKQAEANSGQVLGMPPKYLVVPIDLDKTAYDLIAAPRNSDFDPTSADFTRTLQMELIVVPYWTDANNWYLVANPLDIPTIEVGFLDGKEEPELFVQDLPNVGSMFNSDKLTYKIRHIYGGAVIDYRGLDGSIVA